MDDLHATTVRSSANDRSGHGILPASAAEWLHFAATPTFGIMALLTGIAGSEPAGMLCPAAHGMSSLGGMASMYALMGAFHSAPWLKLVSLTGRGMSRRGRRADMLFRRTGESDRR